MKTADSQAPNASAETPRPTDAPYGSGAEAEQAALAEHAAIVKSAESADAARRAAPPRATFLRSFHHAGSGLWYVIRTQRNMRVHLTIAAAALTLGLILRLSPAELAVIVVTIAVVTVAEMVNTVAEACVDLATQEWHPIAKVAKDVAAGAVLLAAILAVVVGLLIFLPHLWPLALHLLGR